MKLRSPLCFQQLIFATIAFALAAQASANETILLNTGVQKSVEITGVTGTQVMVKSKFGQEGIPIANIKSIFMAEPPEVKAALAAMEAKDYDKAMVQARTIVSKYRGLPTPWAVSLTALIGDIYLAKGDAAGADAAYNEFAKAYPGNGGADLGRARVAVFKKDYPRARKTAEPICAAALADKNVSPQDSQLYGQAFYVMGEVKSAEGDFNGALEDYLRTVTLFYHDRSAVALAQDRADNLRKEHSAFVP